MIHRSESRTTVAAPHSLPTSPATTFFDWGGRRASAASPFSDAAQASSEAQAVPSILNNASPLKSSVSSFSDLNSHRRSARVSIPLLWDDVNFESDDSPDGLPKYASGVSQSLFSNKPRFSMQPRPHEQPWSADVKASLNLPLDALPPSRTISPTVARTDTVQLIQGPDITQRLSCDSSASAFTISAYEDPDLYAPNTTTHLRGPSSDSTTFLLPPDTSTPKSRSSKNLPAAPLLGLERARQLARSASSKSSLDHVRLPITVLSDDLQSPSPLEQLPQKHPGRSLQAARSSPDLVSDQHVATLGFLGNITPSRQSTDSSETTRSSYSMAHFPDYVTLLIDQESHRETKLVMEALHPIGTEEKITYTPYLGSVQPMAFSSSRFQQAPALRKLEVGGCDFLSRQASFSLKYNGTWNIRGKENGAVWTLQYSVDDKLRTNGKRVAGEKVLNIISFTCDPGVVDPQRNISRSTKLAKGLLPKATPILQADVFEWVNRPPPHHASRDISSSRSSISKKTGGVVKFLGNVLRPSSSRQRFEPTPTRVVSRVPLSDNTFSPSDTLRRPATADPKISSFSNSSLPAKAPNSRGQMLHVSSHLHLNPFPGSLDVLRPVTADNSQTFFATQPSRKLYR